MSDQPSDKLMNAACKIMFAPFEAADRLPRGIARFVGFGVADAVMLPWMALTMVLIMPLMMATLVAVFWELSGEDR